MLFNANEKEGVFDAYTQLYSHRAFENVVMGVSSVGSKRIQVWVNGKLVFTSEKRSSEILGADWMQFTVPSLDAGRNHIFVRVIAEKETALLRMRFGEYKADASGISPEGYIKRWAMIGPWPNPPGKRSHFPPESSPDHIDAPDGLLLYRTSDDTDIFWNVVDSRSAFIDHPHRKAVSYGFVEIESEESINCLASIGAGNCFAIWINGEEVGKTLGGGGHRFDMHTVPVHLKKGKNAVLFKVSSFSNPGGYSLRFLTDDKEPVPLRVVTPAI